MVKHRGCGCLEILYSTIFFFVENIEIDIQKPRSNKQLQVRSPGGGIEYVTIWLVPKILLPTSPERRALIAFTEKNRHIPVSMLSSVSVAHCKKDGSNHLPKPIGNGSPKKGPCMKQLL